MSGLSDTGRLLRQSDLCANQVPQADAQDNQPDALVLRMV